MAKVKIQGNASGTGVITLIAPNTNTDRTVTLPDESITLGGGVDGIVSTADATAITIDSSENVGIGGAPLSGYRLHVLAPSGAHCKMKIQATTATGQAELDLTSDPAGVSYLNMGDEDNSNIGRIAYHQGDNSMRFTTNSTERMRIDSAGRVTMPYQPFFSGTLPTGTTKASGWTYPSNHFTDVRENRGNHYSTSTGLFTCPVDGDYEVKTGGFISTNSDGTRYGPMLQKNGSAAQIGGIQLSDGDTPSPINSFIISCSANDTLKWELAYCPISVTYSTGTYGFLFQARLLG